MTRGELRVGDTPDGEAVTIPVAIVRGAGEGPSLWINGCVHGDEYCGAFIIHEMLRTLDATSLPGSWWRCRSSTSRPLSAASG